MASVLAHRPAASRWWTAVAATALLGGAAWLLTARVVVVHVGGSAVAWAAPVGVAAWIWASCLAPRLWMRSLALYLGLAIVFIGVPLFLSSGGYRWDGEVGASLVSLLGAVAVVAAYEVFRPRMPRAHPLDTLVFALLVALGEGIFYRGAWWPYEWWDVGIWLLLVVGAGFSVRVGAPPAEARRGALEPDRFVASPLVRRVQFVTGLVLIANTIGALWWSDGDSDLHPIGWLAAFAGGYLLVSLSRQRPHRAHRR